MSRIGMRFPLKSKFKYMKRCLAMFPGRQRNFVSAHRSCSKTTGVAPRGFYSNHLAYDTVRFGPMAGIGCGFQPLPQCRWIRWRRGVRNRSVGLSDCRCLGCDICSGIMFACNISPCQQGGVSGMFEYSDQSEAIATFESMFNASDRTPVLMKSTDRFGMDGI